MKDEVQQPRPPYTRTPLYLLGQLDSYDPPDDVYDDVREMIVNMLRLLEEAEEMIRDWPVSGYVDQDLAGHIRRLLRGEDGQADG